MPKSIIVKGYPKTIQVAGIGTLMVYEKYSTEYDATRAKIRVEEAGFKSVVTKHNIKKDDVTPENYGVYFRR
ncbi:MAG: hypothetical protein WCX79_00130 [Candidatus Paceibacterota bacterium]|jgi:hypothetical protein